MTKGETRVTETQKWALDLFASDPAKWPMIPMQTLNSLLRRGLLEQDELGGPMRLSDKGRRAHT